jgi:hypothetical protein
METLDVRELARALWFTAIVSGDVPVIEIPVPAVRFAEIVALAVPEREIPFPDVRGVLPSTPALL